MSPPSDTLDSENRESGDFLGASPGDVPLDPIAGIQVALVGRFGGMNHREATNLLRSRGAVVVSVDSKELDWVVIGADEPPLTETELLSRRILDAAASGSLEVLHETDLWERMGLVDVEQSIRRYHTPAMLAHLLGVSVRVIRRWQRLGLITPIRTVHKLPYFDYQEVATARQLAQWIAAGIGEKAIEQRLVELVEVLPGIRSPLDQLSILVEGKHVLLRQGDGLLESSGQMRFDFDALDAEGAATKTTMDRDPVVSVSMETSRDPAHQTQVSEDQLLAAAFDAEDNDQLQTAIDYYHAILARDGPQADISFQIGELLYRMGEPTAARERYYAAIEQDPEFVEARASLGAVLAETGQGELAIAAFKGALSLHEDYAVIHYQLARVLEELGRDSEAKQHWQRFNELSPNSPWSRDIDDPQAD